MPLLLRRAFGLAGHSNGVPKAVASSLRTGPRSPGSPPSTTTLMTRISTAFFTSSPTCCLKRNQMPPRPKHPPEADIEESFLKGSGPGGQKINKTNSAVQLKHIPTGIVVKCQETRSREQNRKIARDLLAAKLDILANGDQSRTVIVGNVKKKRSDSAAKKSRRKYKKLAEEKEGGQQQPKEKEEQNEEDDDDRTGGLITEGSFEEREGKPFIELMEEEAISKKPSEMRNVGKGGGGGGGGKAADHDDDDGTGGFTPTRKDSRI
ncbi:RF-1 domain-containing protein [Apodospora peruviana]|uniref:RF-1 domain-containing protein n=1 Tax=Apodospora peruviana TaxID=516989 RepID=A0AAE0IJY4_9PEZI|nr:RF-1 domain-containing protein [Apodospora peruviana]